MTKRNLILLIIVMFLVVISIFVFLFFRPTTSTPGNEESDINFISQFNPFGNSKPDSPAMTPSTEVGEYQPNPVVEIEKKKLAKISSMPIAGFTVFSKERLKEMPTTEASTMGPEKPYSLGSTTLKNGSAGEAVKEIRRFLNDTLHLSLETNGPIDTEVVATIKQWQSANGLVADGIVGAKTKEAMYSSVNQQTEITKQTAPATEFIPALRYVDKATGNIYQTFVDKILEQKFSATIIPKVYEAYFGNNGGSVLMRYLKGDGRTIETFVGNLPKELLGADIVGNNEIKGMFLPNDVEDVGVSPDNMKIFYLFNSADSQFGTILNLTNNKKTQIFISPFTEWLSFWPTNNTITLTTKPSANIPGYMYSMDGAGKNLTKTLGGINGLTTLESPKGKTVLYSDNNLSLNIYHTDIRNVETLGVRTLSEKCIWSKLSDTVYCAVPKSIPAQSYPDSWYQGEVSFSDQIWEIDAKTGNATMVLDPITIVGGEEVDGIKLALDDSENYLFFVNKKDSFLWELNLK